MSIVVILFSRFGPYHVARIGAAARRLATEGLTVVGMEVARTDSEYAWDPITATPGFERITLFPDQTYDATPPAAIAAALHAALDRLQPAAVALPGWSAPEALAGLRWCRSRGARAILMSESARNDAPRAPHREFVKRCIVRHFDAALVGGSRHAAYAAELGLPPASIHLGYDVVDNAHFTAGADRARADAAALRTRLRLPESYVVASARFVPKKNLPVLLNAFARFRATPGTPPWHLVLCGDGPDRAALERLAAESPFAGAIHFAGFTSYHDLPIYYGLASAFIHASTVEQWGLVVNEALAAGLPVLVSNRCGCAPELVQDGRNGFTFNPHDTNELTALLTRIATMPPAERMALGAAGRTIAAAWSPERFAEGLAATLASAQRAPARPSWIARVAFCSMSPRLRGESERLSV